MDALTEHRLEALRAAAPPEVRRFVEWVAGELCDRLEAQVLLLGLPPELARRLAADTVRLVARDVFATAKRYHALKDAPYVGKPPWE